MENVYFPTTCQYRPLNGFQILTFYSFLCGRRCVSTKLMKGYSGVNMTASNDYFNKRISRACRVVENPFGIFFARWRILLRTLHTLPENAKTIVLASVALHNNVNRTFHNTTQITSTRMMRFTMNLNSLRPRQNGHVCQWNTSTADRDQVCLFINNNII